MADIVNMMMFVEHGKSFPAKLNIKGSVSAKSLIGYTEYTARDDSRDIDQDKEIEINDGYLGYTSREGSRIDDKEIRTFSSDGWIPADTQMEFRKKIAKYFCKDGDLAWIPVTSFKDYFTAEQYGLMNEEDYAAVMTNALPKFFNRVGLDPNNMIWWFDYHTNKNHPHTHLVFMEKEKTRTKGVFKQDDVNYFKGLIITEANKRLQLIKGISSDKSLFVEKDLMMNDVKRDLYDYLTSKKDEKIEGAIKKLFDKMDNDMFKGRLQYGSSHIIPYRKDLDNIVNMLFAHPEVQHKLNEFTKLLKQFDEGINKATNSDINTFSNSEVGKLKKQLANKVLSLKKDYVSEASSSIGADKVNRSKQHLTRMDASPEELVNAYRYYDEKTDDVCKRILNSSKRIMKDEPELLGDILASGVAGKVDYDEAVKMYDLANNDWSFYKASEIMRKQGKTNESLQYLSKMEMPLGKVKQAFHYFSTDRKMAIHLMENAALKGDKFANEFLDDMNANNKLLANQPTNKAAVFSALESIANAQSKVMQMMKLQDIETYYEGKGIDHDS